MNRGHEMEYGQSIEIAGFRIPHGEREHMLRQIAPCVPLGFHRHRFILPNKPDRPVIRPFMRLTISLRTTISSMRHAKPGIRRIASGNRSKIRLFPFRSGCLMVGSDMLSYV
jgi:hypothetical protein